jgi:hypothetical protein
LRKGNRREEWCARSEREKKEGGEQKTHLILLEHLRLLQTLHRIDLACVNLLNESDLRMERRLFVNSASFEECKKGNEWGKAAQRTSPKAPFPITFTVLKSSKPNLVLLNLKKLDSVRPS